MSRQNRALFCGGCAIERGDVWLVGAEFAAYLLPLTRSCGV
jgi:hypothetical protein